MLKDVSNGISPAHDTLMSKLEPWLNNIPDYHDVKTAYELSASLKKRIRLLQRDISKAEDDITAVVDRPRSNETKQAKLKATSGLKDKLAELEADNIENDELIKLLEYRKTMLNAANYRTKIQYEL